ncbi:tRNA(fMet)-specific endonuclease VapC [subsurface metagenome]|nr:PIN domain-containing protein [Methanosarcinales archaeon]
MALGNLSALPTGEKIYIDSTILTYHLFNDPVHGKRCKEFIGRVENGEFEGFISPIIISETLFNFIKANIVKDYGIKPKEVVSFLKVKPTAISNIDIRKASDLFGIFCILPISELEVEACYKAIKDHALLTNDAFHVATMKGHGITNIATNDPDFERVGWLKVWKP